MIHIKNNKLEQQTYIKRYETTAVFFGLKYTNYYYEEILTKGVNPRIIIGIIIISSGFKFIANRAK